MSAAKRGGLKWPVCTVLILALLGGVIYRGYTAYQAEQAMTQAQVEAGAKTPPAAAAPPPAGYRSAFPVYFLVGFAVLMAVLLGSIIYFWWTLKDLEGGRRYGEEEDAETPEETPAP